MSLNKDEVSEVKYSIPLKLRKRLYNLGDAQIDENDLLIAAIKFFVKKKSKNKKRPIKLKK